MSAPTSDATSADTPDAGSAAARRAEILSAVPTPFDAQGALDQATFTALLRRIEPHVDGAFVAGTTGEFPALSAAERETLLDLAVEVFGPGRVVAHIGAASLAQILPFADSALDRGITRLACLTPYYLPCEPEQVTEFFRTIADHVRTRGGEVFVYLFPERSGLDITPEHLGELTRIEGIAGAKISGRPNDRIEEYIAACSPGSKVYSGDDASLPRIMAAGGSGVVSGVSSTFPARFARLREALADSTTERDRLAETAQDAVVEAVRLVGPTIPRLKYALAQLHPDESWASRMTLTSLDDATAEQIRELVAAGD